MSPSGRTPRVVAGIPARMGSSRFPGKPLCDILGKTMVEHCWRRSRESERLDDLFVATCDEEIRDVVEGFGGRAIMTPKDISRPGLRVAEACKELDLDDEDIVIVVQGDEPLVHPGMIDLAAQALIGDTQLQVGTLVGAATEEEWLDPNEVKVVHGANGDVLYLSRAPIPSNTRDRVLQRLKQICILPFRKRFLLDFEDLAETPLEVAESIELIRVVEHGIRLKAIHSPYPSVAVDNEEDRRRAEAAMRDDEIYARYAGASASNS